jgi:hypothetical protein
VTVKPPRQRKYKIGKHHIAITTYNQYDDKNRDWGIKLNHYGPTWYLDLYTGRTINVLHIRKDYYV